MTSQNTRQWVVTFCGLLAGLCAMGYGKVIYVDDDVVWADDGISWVSAFTYLQDALAVAEPGDEVRVAQGLYRPDHGAGMAPGDRDATFSLVSGATLAGGYAGLAGVDPEARNIERYKTILSGDLNGDDGPAFSNYADNSRYGVVSSLGNDATTVLEGVTITGGYSGEGAGIRCFDSDTLISECRIVRNKAQGNGAGMVGYLGSPVLRQCVFEDNEARGHGGGLWCEGGDLRMTKCDFVNNSAVRSGVRHSSSGAGGAIYVSGSSDGQTVLDDCLFQGNQAVSGGAIHGHLTTLRRCRFTGNVAQNRGGALDIQGGLNCESCLFDGNQALDEAAVVRSYGPLRFSHCTFVDNPSPDNRVFRAFGGHGSPVDIIFINCIVWGGVSGLDFERVWPSYARVTYSNVQGGWVGRGNTDADPCFADPGFWDSQGTPDDTTDDSWIAGDYHLKSQAGRWDPVGEMWVQDKASSPSIDGGDPFAPIGDEPFPTGGIANMGAYGAGAEASKTFFGYPVCEIRMAGDINGDCKVDLEDLLIVVAQWTDCAPEPSAVAIVEPADGATLELGLSEPITIRAVVSDPDFVASNVRFEITYGAKGAGYEGGFTARNVGDGWYYEWTWWNDLMQIPPEGDYTITATATNPSGLTEVSEPVAITIHHVTWEPRR